MKAFLEVCRSSYIFLVRSCFRSPRCIVADASIQSLRRFLFNAKSFLHCAHDHLLKCAVFLVFYTIVIVLEHALKSTLALHGGQR